MPPSRLTTTETSIGLQRPPAEPWRPGEHLPGNRLLAALSPPDQDLIRPELEPVSLEVRQILHHEGQLVPYAYFVNSGLVSLVGANKGKHRIEVGMVGFEGIAGLDITLGTEQASHEALVQSAGSAFRISSPALRAAMSTSRTLSETLLRFAHVFMVQSHQTAIAAGCGKIDERLARGLLMWHDRVRSDELSATHEFLALLLGVRRQGVTVALHELEGQGWIRSTRSVVRILDRRGLESKAGSFYGVAEEAYRRAFGSIDGATFAPSRAELL